MKRKHTSFILLIAAVMIAVAHTSARAQISGRVTDPDNTPVTDALVSCYGKMTAPLLSCYTDSAGCFILADDSSISARMIVVTAFGFKPDTVTMENGRDRYDIELQPSLLKEVVVSGRRTPKISQRGNKFLVDNISNSPYGVDNNAMGFLKYVPLVSVSETSGEIKIHGSLYGKATVLRNGKTLNVPQEQWLRTLRIEDVERIEVSPNPLGDYKVSNTGVINIILKRRPDEGVKYSLYMLEKYESANSVVLAPAVNHSGRKTIVNLGIDYQNTKSNIESFNLYQNTVKTRKDIVTDRVNSNDLTPYIDLDLELNPNNRIGIQSSAFFSDLKRDYTIDNTLISKDDIVSNLISNSKTTNPQKLVNYKLITNSILITA